MNWKKARSKFFLSLILMLTLLVTTSLFASQDFSEGASSRNFVFVDDVKVIVNGEEVYFDRPLLNAQNRLLIPLRSVGEALGAQFQWQEQSRTILMIDGENRVAMWPERYEVEVNNRLQRIDVAPIIEEGRTYVPLRFVSEIMGNKVDWIEASRSAFITSLNPRGTVPSPTHPTERMNEQSFINLQIGDTEEKVRRLVGEPARIDPGEYGYNWWIYNRNPAHLFMVGIGNGQVRAIFSSSESFSLQGVTIGSSYSAVEKTWPLRRSVNYPIAGGQIGFELTAEDLRTRPLIIEGNQALIFYIDRHGGNKVAGIMMMDVPSLFASQRYGYRISTRDRATFQQWEQRKGTNNSLAVAQAYERQVLDLTNAARWQALNDLEAHAFLSPSLSSMGRMSPRGAIEVKWHENMAQVARAHSQDMATHRFFNHTSPNTGTFSDRMKKSGVTYWHAGENLAMGQADAIDAHFGWINSLGHRENLLNPVYNNLGIGVVYGTDEKGRLLRYYTQNFITQ
ncbi:CAP-associated domain-containing protein [Heliorestis convoluta]|uniref:Secretory family protein, putative n=1 Tax=Heliorestis convoluta TaxID=356322 RepID=A0A5Q2N5D5_9FIRM|nr:CAP-associated domain-containing protein [Heliorestis convoluta]QGG47450.1 secretory family protein, putative [Heliorestis convoluta]